MTELPGLHLEDGDRVDLEAPPALLSGTRSRARLVAMMGDNVMAILLAFVLSAKLPVPDERARGFILAAAYLGYYLVPEAIWGRTLMKRICHLVVRRVDGGACGWKEATLRTATRILEVNPLLLGALPGAITVVLSKRCQRMGDMLARTVVLGDAADARR